MEKPRVFIGSSTEGLPIAEPVFTRLSRDSTPTLWTNQLFLPGQYPLEALEKKLHRHFFAVLVASPDDEMMTATSYERFLAVATPCAMCRMVYPRRRPAGYRVSSLSQSALLRVVG